MSQDLENQVEELRSEIENLKLEEKRKSIRNALYKAGVEDAHKGVKGFEQDYDLKSLDLSNINQIIANWKNTKFGSVFFPEKEKETKNETTKRRRSAEEISKGLKEGSLKLKLN
ncbi:hypothetical protein VF14_31785 [Nostoc linckia z18]|uniref:Uncharacterized protein n=2 Tax=Nostoc linckia TaxID=92942 RepID=A0A9Q5Z5V4_NOSLI|nr:hypothetical protein [Nostoc linckia]PHK34606.1 hypothetical protein VF12_23535 [Nostoc linckia z15]PHK41169.1 hypothetical protein VF13_31640 [Nostoc linckia z16]PHJ55777.1 hypothetical protein VF02_35400 [Nostoc linckia z1]PHJ56991.1 hypothetical protein VF05_36420 [Nostoc linckia z3]PHJ58285.1 hypothetical protein VF03_35605 [Nostoc linckia z2]